MKQLTCNLFQPVLAHHYDRHTLVFILDFDMSEFIYKSQRTFFGYTTHKASNPRPKSLCKILTRGLLRLGWLKLASCRHANYADRVIGNILHAQAADDVTVLAREEMKGGELSPTRAARLKVATLVHVRGTRTVHTCST